MITKKRLKELKKVWEDEFVKHQQEEQEHKSRRETMDAAVSRNFKMIALGRVSMIDDLLEECDET